MRDAVSFTQAGGHTTVPLDLAPYGSLFVVFRKVVSPGRAGVEGRNFPQPERLTELRGTWNVRFDPKWGGPESVLFERLVDWKDRPEEGDPNIIAGTATYLKSFDLDPGLAGGKRRLFLDLGAVRELARVRLNGRDLGVVWTPPWRVEITHAAKPSGNALEVEVVNLWPNRLIGDAALPIEQRRTQTNVAFTGDQPLLPSGLLGPVTVQVAR